MKRVAEKQIIKDGAEEEDSEFEGQIGLQKADDTVLAGRKMKALPKRSTGAPSSLADSVSSESATASPSKFSGFGGFGTNSNTGFQFTPPASPSVFSAPPSAPSSPFAVASTASNAAKTFSSFLGSSPEQKTTSKPAPLTSQPTLPNVEETDSDAPAIEYYKSLRGLNVSFIAALTAAVDKDPFADAALLLQRYKDLRIDVQKEYDQKASKKENKSSSASISTASATSVGMPTPPASFSGFGQTLASSSSLSGSGGFTPKLDSSKPSSSPFSFPSSTSTPNPPTTSSLFPPAGSLAPQKDDVSKPSESSFSTSIFGGSSTPSSSSSLFGDSSKSNPFSAPTLKPAFGFGASSTSDTTTSLFGAPAPGSSVFGSPGKSTTSASSPFGTPTSGATGAPKFGGFGGFGGATKTSPSAGSIGNPVGFGFGSPTKTDSGTSASPFSFAKEPSSSSSNPLEEAKEPSEGTQSEGNDGSALLFGSNPHDEEGEGEEAEETVHSIRLKAFRMKKANDGTNSWADMGTGVLRLKKHKETGQRRMLLRNSSTGKIIINFNLYGGLKPSLTKKAIMFVGHEEDGGSQTYNVRTKTEDQANELKNVLDREIAFVKAKLGE